MSSVYKKIGHVAKVKGGKRLPKGMSVLDEATEHPYLRVVDFGNHGINRSDIKYIDAQTFDYIKRYTIDSSDIYISIAGTIGRVGIVPKDLSGANLTENAAKITDISEDIDHRYLMYYLRSPIGQGAIRNRAGGTSQPKLALYKITDIDFPYRPLSMQKSIASILSAYDDLIENNQRRIQLLEQSAQLLYKEWFVHLRFPGHEHVTITDGVPEGWVKKPLGEIADITMGQSPKSIYYNEDGNGLPFHQGVTNFGIRFPARQKYCTVQNRLAETGDILFSVRAPVGRINIALDKIIIGRGLAAIRSRTGQQNFLFYALKNWFFKEDIMGSGAIFAAITKKDLHGVELLQTSDQIAEMFMAHVVPIDLQIEKLHQSNEQLTQARDVLLPRLMSGEIVQENYF